jgi:hypothetical protein
MARWLHAGQLDEGRLQDGASAEGDPVREAALSDAVHDLGLGTEGSVSVPCQVAAWTVLAARSCGADCSRCARASFGSALLEPPTTPDTRSGSGSSACCQPITEGRQPAAVLPASTRAIEYRMNGRTPVSLHTRRMEDSQISDLHGRSP